MYINIPAALLCLWQNEMLVFSALRTNRVNPTVSLHDCRPDTPRVRTCTKAFHIRVLSPQLFTACNNMQPRAESTQTHMNIIESSHTNLFLNRFYFSGPDCAYCNIYQQSVSLQIVVNSPNKSVLHNLS